jgi:predicted CXXCH cytochrome family protein
MKSWISHTTLLITAFLLIGCSPKSGSGVLSFFFDGVPEPAKQEQVATPAAAVQKSDSGSIQLAQAVPAGPVLNVHTPYERRQCDKCHNNAAGSSRLTQSQTGICYACHQDYQVNNKYMHGPVAAGYCSACHAPHESVNEKLLKNTGQAMCLICHTDDQVNKNKAHATIGTTDCTKCHNPHGGNNTYFLQ